MDKSSQKPRKVSILHRIIIILCGLLLAALALEIGLRVSGFIRLSLQEYKNLRSVREKGSCRIMCLGESTTQNQYPPYLEETLNERNIGIKFSVIDKGLATTTTMAILLQLEANLDKYQPDIVVAMMGCNDDSIMYYQDIPGSGSWLFRHCRAYRFVRLIYMHILKKLKKESIYKVKSSYPNQQGKPIRIEGPSKKAVRLNPKRDSVYLVLGRLYKNQGRYPEAEQALKQAIGFNPQDDCAYTELSRLYRDQGRNIEAEQTFKKAIELNHQNDFAHIELGRFYRDQGRNIEAEQAFKKAIELDTQNYYAYIILACIYKDQKRYVESGRVFKQAVELNPENALAYGGLAAIYREMGKDELSSEYAAKADQLRDKLNNATINNYRKLKKVLDKKGINLICVQYPMLSVQPLKKIFQEDENIVFVDN
ncbi:MAG: tetratricopeptide repeat protein, partial [bacterium]